METLNNFQLRMSALKMQYNFTIWGNLRGSVEITRRSRSENSYASSYKSAQIWHISTSTNPLKALSSEFWILIMRQGVRAKTLLIIFLPRIPWEK